MRLLICFLFSLLWKFYSRFTAEFRPSSVVHCRCLYLAVRGNSTYICLCESWEHTILNLWSKQQFFRHWKFCCDLPRVSHCACRGFVSLCIHTTVKYNYNTYAPKSANHANPGGNAMLKLHITSEYWRKIFLFKSRWKEAT